MNKALVLRQLLPANLLWEDNHWTSSVCFHELTTAMLSNVSDTTLRKIDRTKMLPLERCLVKQCPFAKSPFCISLQYIGMVCSNIRPEVLFGYSFLGALLILVLFWYPFFWVQLLKRIKGVIRNKSNVIVRVIIILHASLHTLLNTAAVCCQLHWLFSWFAGKKLHNSVRSITRIYIIKSSNIAVINKPINAQVQ